jgi:hypothetical protein
MEIIVKTTSYSKYLSNTFLTHNGLRQGDSLRPFLFKSIQKYATRNKKILYRKCFKRCFKIRN